MSESFQERDAYIGAARKAAADGWVYFIRGADLIKIGQTSWNPRQRFAGIQSMSPIALTLEAVAPGSSTEFDLHDRFHESRAHGEWFRSTSQLERLLIETVSRYGTPEPLFGVPEHLYRLALADVLDEKDERVHLSQLRMQARELARRINDPTLTEDERERLYRSTTLIRNAYTESKFGVRVEPHG